MSLQGLEYRSDSRRYGVPSHVFSHCPNFQTPVLRRFVGTLTRLLPLLQLNDKTSSSLGYPHTSSSIASHPARTTAREVSEGKQNRQNASFAYRRARERFSDSKPPYYGGLWFRPRAHEEHEDEKDAPIQGRLAPREEHGVVKRHPIETANCHTCKKCYALAFLPIVSVRSNNMVMSARRRVLVL